LRASRSDARQSQISIAAPPIAELIERSSVSPPYHSPISNYQQKRGLHLHASASHDARTCGYASAGASRGSKRNRTCACVTPVPPQGVRRKASLSGLRIAFTPVPALPTGAGKKARGCRQVQVVQNRYVIPAPHRGAGRESNQPCINVVTAAATVAHQAVNLLFRHRPHRFHPCQNGLSNGSVLPASQATSPSDRA